jgi:transcriptional regulator with XRE-family HTH domain
MSSKKMDISFISEFHCNINAMVEQESGNMRTFAKKISVDPDTVRSWCIGETLPNGKQLLKIHQIFKISLDWLLTGKRPGEEEIPNDWSPEVKKACETMKKIMESGDAAIITALTTNLAAFEISVDRKSDNDDLRKDLDTVKKEIRHLKKLSEKGRLTGSDQGG